MARPLRIEYPGALYHLTSRGDGREDIFLDDRDRERFLKILGQVCGRFGWAVHAYCLMTNHYHLLAETADANLARGMRQLNGVYTQAFNRAHDRVGHVFQGRYHAVLVQKESHLLELGRYVVLNPVRARLARRAEDWRWSSYRAVMGLAPAPAWLDGDGLLSAFGKRRDRARRAYARFVAEGVGADSPWQRLRHQVFLGDDAFIAGAVGDYAAGNLDEVPRAQRRSLALPLADYRRRHPDRDRAMAHAYLSGAYTMKEIAAAFGVHYMTVSRAVRKVERGEDLLEC